MKKVILIGFVFLFTLGIFKTNAQTYFSTEGKTFTYWDIKQERFIPYDETDDTSLFELNEQETMFKHTTTTMTSTYYIKKKEYDKIKEIWTYSVISDVGNKYTYIFDPKNNQIRALLSMEKNGNTYIIMIVFHIKRFWNENSKKEIKTYNKSTYNNSSNKYL